MKRWIALAVTVIVFAAILAKIDRAALWNNLRATRPVPFLAALALFLPQNLIIVYRWKKMASNFIPMGWKESAKLILASQSMNIILPSKMGDLTKAYFLSRSGAMDLPRAVNLVVFEKMLDLGSLCLLALAGVAGAYALRIHAEDSRTFAALSIITVVISGMVVLIVLTLYFIPTRRIPFYQKIERFLSARPGLSKAGRLWSSSHEVMQMLQARQSRRGLLVSLSISLWILHLVQIYTFFLSLDAPVPILAFSTLMPLAIFVGLLPLSLFGMGTRDAAIIFLFSPYHPAATMAGVGLYVNLRYIVPALSGLPFLHHYMRKDRQILRAE